MKKKQLLIFTPIIFFMLMLIDGQISYLLKIWSKGDALASSHLLLIAILFANRNLSTRYLVLATFVIGFLMDSYFSGLVGINATILPLVAYFSGSIKETIHENPVTEYFSLIIFITGYEIAIYVIHLLFQLAKFNLFDFVGDLLAPTLLFNSCIFLVLYKVYQFIFNDKMLLNKAS